MPDELPVWVRGGRGLLWSSNQLPAPAAKSYRTYLGHQGGAYGLPNVTRGGWTVDESACAITMLGSEALGKPAADPQLGDPMSLVIAEFQPAGRSQGRGSCPETTTRWIWASACPSRKRPTERVSQ